MLTPVPPQEAHPSNIATISRGRMRGAGGARRGSAPHALLAQSTSGGRRGASYPDRAQDACEDGEPEARPRRGLSLRGAAAPLSLSSHNIAP